MGGGHPGLVSDGARTLIAQYGTGHDGWKLYLTARAELADGTPCAETTLLDSEDGPKPWPTGMKRDLVQRFDQGDGQAIYYMRLGFRAREILLGDRNREETAAPAEMKNWLQGAFIDLSADIWKATWGSPSSKKIGAYYDPRTSILITAGSSGDLDALETVFSPPGCSSEQSVWLETNPVAGGWGLLTQSGCAGVVTRSHGQEKDLIFNIEPTCYKEIDLRFVASVVTEN